MERAPSERACLGLTIIQLGAIDAGPAMIASNLPRTPPDNAPDQDCVLPRRMNSASRIFLDNYIGGDISIAEFRRWFSMPNSEYLALSTCLQGLHE
ncbi:MAG: hypothetical protein ACE10A_11325 [Acidiferrobacterales bacterium]